MTVTADTTGNINVEDYGDPYGMIRNGLGHALNDTFSSQLRLYSYMQCPGAYIEGIVPASKLREKVAPNPRERLSSCAKLVHDKCLASSDSATLSRVAKHGHGKWRKSLRAY